MTAAGGSGSSFPGSPVLARLRRRREGVDLSIR